MRRQRALPKSMSVEMMDGESAKWREEISRFEHALERAPVFERRLFLRLRYYHGWRFLEQGMVPIPLLQERESWLRLADRGRAKWARLPPHREHWQRGESQLVRTLPSAAIGAPFGPICDETQLLNTSDPALTTYLSDGERFFDLASAIHDNFLHESNHSPSRPALQGDIFYAHTLRIIVQNQNIAHAWESQLSLRLILDHRFSERWSLRRAPSSFLPLALSGARLWRQYHQREESAETIQSDASVLFHPRAFESLLRAVLPALLTPRNVERPALHAELTVRNAPLLDGLLLSEAFDDLGVIRGEECLIQSGYVKAEARIDPLGGEWGHAGLTPRFSNLLVDAGNYSRSDFPHEKGSIYLERATAQLDLKEAVVVLTALRGLTLKGELIPHRSMLTVPIERFFSGRSEQEQLFRLSRERMETPSGLFPFAWIQL
ncbi:MAG: hypothetical protein VYD19_08015 [Myxococcota bacterium]|nr:hypothetical protein [Myxococcota bacterium]